MSVEIRKLHKRLGARQVLCGVDLTIAPSEVVVILGQNGSGKSTSAAGSVAGILEPDSRTDLSSLAVLFRGVASLARQQIGYVPDTSDPLPDLLVAELCALVCSLKQAPAPSAI
jgi:ABC-type multidrug transport system ATPase subunit